METGTTRDDWDTLSALFSVGRTRLARSWHIGMSSRLNGARLNALRQRSGAGKLDRFLAERGAERVKALRTFAAINLEQATAALRITVIVNVTIPVVILTVLNLIAPGSLADLLQPSGDSPQGLLLALGTGFLATLLWLSVILGYGIARLSDARDIRHLIDLHAAERGIYFGLEDMDDLQPG